MYYFFTPAILLNLLFFAVPIFGFKSPTFENGYAIIRPMDSRVGFDLDYDKSVEILLLKDLEEPSFDSSPFGLRIKRNCTRSGHHIYFTICKEGEEWYAEKQDVNDEWDLRRIMLSWENSGRKSIRISSIKRDALSTLFRWEDEQENGSPINITFIAFNTSDSLTIRQTDSFLWISDVLTRCPLQNAEILCGLNINRPHLNLAEAGNSSTPKGLRKVMEMDLISKYPDDLQNNYEISIGVNQTSAKMEPRLHILQHNITKLKMDGMLGYVNVSVNMSSGIIMLSKRGDLVPYLLWKDPVKTHTQGFQDIKYFTVQVQESRATLRKLNSDNPPSICKLMCKSKENKMSFSQWWENLFTSSNSHCT